MSRVRPLEREDLPAVMELYELVMRSGSRRPPPGLRPYFERTVLDQPWADPELPPLVYEGGDGEVLGFMASHVRRLRFDGRPIRLRCGGQLVSEPAARRRGVGAVLLRDFLSGPQDVTITDGATPEVAAMWERLGGAGGHLHSLVWTRFLRPARTVRRLLERRGRRGLAVAAAPVWPVVDAAARPFSRPDPEGDLGETEELTPESLLEHLPAMIEGARLYVDYDEPFLRWVFDEMAAVRTRGPLQRRAVTSDGRFAGWYVAYLPRRGMGQVMQVAGTERTIGLVLDRLLHDAWSAGAAALEGRLEPLVFEALSGRRGLIRYGDRAMVHARDPEVLDAISGGRAMLTRMDGEWWMGHHVEPFD